MIFKALLIGATGYIGYQLMHNEHIEDNTPTPRKSSTFKSFSSGLDHKNQKNPFMPVFPNHP